MDENLKLVTDHYERGDLMERISTALEQAGITEDSLTLEDLGPMEEFHTRGREATQELIQDLGILSAMHVLDVGSGIGGPARYIAHTCGAHVVGIDLTPEFRKVATELSQRTGLSEKVEFVTGNATNLPFEDRSFDIVITEHASMNIENKDRMYTEMYRVLKQDGSLGLYDIMAGEGELIFPVPWANTQAESYLIPPEEVRKKLEVAGFSIHIWADKTPAVLRWFEELSDNFVQKSTPAIGIHLMFGDNASIIAKNLGENLQAGRLRIYKAIATKN